MNPGGIFRISLGIPAFLALREIMEWGRPSLSLLFRDPGALKGNLAIYWIIAVVMGLVVSFWIPKKKEEIDWGRLLRILAVIPLVTGLSEILASILLSFRMIGFGDVVETMKGNIRGHFLNWPGIAMMLGLVMIVASLRLRRRPRPLPIYLPRGVKADRTVKEKREARRARAHH